MLLADIVGSPELFKKLSCEMRNGLIRSINSIWQSRVVTEVGKQFREFAEQGGFGTASLATYFAPTRSFSMCNIGNPPPLVYRASTRTWEALHGEADETAGNGSEPIDGVYAPEEYRHAQTKLAVGDIVLIYGNGFSQSSFPGGSIVGHSKLIDALRDSPHSCPISRVEHLIGLVQTSKNGSNVPDIDSTIILCQVSESPVRLVDNILAPFRLFKRPVDTTHLE
jgi:hypothetical protein